MAGASPDAILSMMQRAVSLHREGRLEDAERAYREVLARDPAHAEALHLLGLLLHRGGRSAEGLALIDRALAADPTLAAAWSNRALALRALGRPAEAARSLERALELRPELVEARLNLARLRAALGDRPAALAAAAEAARLAPEGSRLLAALLAEAGRWAEAARALEDAFARGPADRAGLRLLAQCWQEAGQGAKAEALYRRVLADADGAAEEAGLLGGLLLREGRAAEALPWLARAAAAAPEDPRPALALVDAIGLLPEPGPALAPTLRALLAREDVDHQRLERAVRAALGPAAAALLEPAPPEAELGAAAEALCEEPLFAAALPRLLLLHPAWERALARLREQALARATTAPLPRAAVEALAAHAWNREHADLADPATLARARALAALPEGDPRTWPALAWDALAAAATALPLDAIPGAARLAAPGWEARPLAALVRQQLVEPAEEARLLPEIPSLTGTEDPTSRAVRAQYEENPYPRLVGLHRRPPSPLGALLRASLERPDLRVAPAGPLEVLVAGCGTGQHALGTATRTADARVLAVDLSLRSLARALRRARALGIGNLRFAQADILGLDVLEPVFHVVESVGVLHHLADPAAGLRVLRDRLRPGGLMLIGLYSERGRREVVAARERIAALGLEPTPEGIRAARADLLALPPEHPAHPVVWSPDFTSLSGTRDLLFHVCERRFTPLGVGALLASLDLELLGFQHARPELGRLYRQRFPEDPPATDLRNWETLEDEHPRLFSGMLVFWCRRAGDPPLQ